MESEQPGVPSLAICTLYGRASCASPTPSVPAMESPTSRTLTGLDVVGAARAGVRYDGTVVVVVAGAEVVVGEPGAVGVPGVAGAAGVAAGTTVDVVVVGPVTA